MPVSDKKKESNARSDNKHWEYITLKARKGSRERIVQAAQATGESINGFIRAALETAVQDATGQRMEPERPEAQN